MENRVGGEEVGLARYGGGCVLVPRMAGSFCVMC